MKRIGILVFGKISCGANTIINNIINLGKDYDFIGIKNGIDGLFDENIEELTTKSISGFEKNIFDNILLKSYSNNIENFLKNGEIKNFNKKLKKTINKLSLDALIIIGDTTAISYEYHYKEVFSDLSLIHIPISINNDIPMTDNCVGFKSAVNKVSNICSQISEFAKTRHKYIILQTFGQGCGNLTLESGLISNADAILTGEIKFDIKELVKKILQKGKGSGIIVVSDGISLRGHSGEISEIISREFNKLGIFNKNIILDIFQILSDLTAEDKLLSLKFADCALEAIRNKETFVMTSIIKEKCETILIDDVFNKGIKVKDLNYLNIEIPIKCIENDSELLNLAIKKDIYIGSYN